MAALVGVVKEAFGFHEVVGPSLPTTTGTTASKMIGCFVTVEFSAGTYAQADDATFAPATVIQNERRSGKTITIRQAAIASPGSENGTTVAAGACTVSSGTVTCPLLTVDLSTEHANAAMSSNWTRAMTFFVSFTEPLG